MTLTAFELGAIAFIVVSFAGCATLMLWPLDDREE